MSYILKVVRPSNLQNWIAANAPASLKAHPRESWRAYLLAQGATGAGLSELELSYLSSNLLYNGDLEIAQAIGVPTTATGRWVDGTAAGSLTNDIPGWTYLSGAGGSVSFDTTTKRNGTASIKMSATVAGNLNQAATSPGVSLANLRAYTVPVLPNTQYTFSGYLKTQANSGVGTGSQGAYIQISERDGATGAQTVSTASSAIAVTQDWTFVTVTVTTDPATRFIMPKLFINNSTGTLLMDAWFDDLTLTGPLPSRLTLSDLWGNKAPRGYGTTKEALRAYYR